MIVRFGGGNSGIAEYLEKGLKYNRHYSRDELDNRIIIDGDLEITDKIINDIPDNDQERYLHITLSFNEPDITVDKMEAAYEDYKKLFLSAYKEGEINTYAEIHQPKTKQLLDKSTQEMYERFPHIHMVIPKRNLLTGGYTNPAGLNLRHVNIWEAIQEKVNNDHGLNSPALSPRISLENYKAVLDRHKLSEFKQNKAGKAKAELFDTIEENNIRTWSEFKAIVSTYGELKVRNEGKDTEYCAVKLPDNPKFTNLNNPIFSKQYIENRDIPRKPLSQYQINNRLKQWEVLSKEIKYIDDASSGVKKAYRALDAEQKADFLNKHEASFYDDYEISESEYESNRFRQSDFEYRGSAPTERRSLHELPVLELVHSGAGRHGLDRAELLLSDDSSGGIQFNKANSDAGLQRPVHRAERRIISDKTQIKSLTSQIIFNIEENAAITKDNDLELFKEIRTHLNPELVLAYAQASHLANIEDHSFYRVKDGSARISFGRYNYNVSDFFTKGLGLEWSETQVILKSLYDAQKEGLEVKPISNDELKKHLINFEDDEYSDKLEQYKRVTNSIGRDESLSFKKITNNYFNEIKRINGLSHLTYKEKQNLKAINVYEKLVAEEYLKAVMYESKQSAYAIKYPFSDHFKNYLIKEQVLDMTLIDRMKNKYLKKPRNQELENSISGKGYDHVLNGKEAARRARLIANMARQNQQLLNNRYGYTFRELRPEQQKDHVVFFKEDKKLFETDSNKTKVLGKPEINAVATALAYSLSRYGNPLEITGTEEFRGQLIEAAARNGLEVEFTDPALNEALKDKLAEIDLEQASENSISAPDLALDPSLSESVAVDKALLDSKQREIEADLKNPNQVALELGAIAINQRFNAHYYEPVTAETAIKDIALYKELNQSPALQAYFAVEMMKVGAVNADYRAEFIKNEPEEFMLANHAARQFTGELEAAYQANKPQEEFGLNLEKVLLEPEVTSDILDEMGVPDVTQPFVEAEAVQHFVDQMENIQYMQSSDDSKTLSEQVEALEAGNSESLSFKASAENETIITLEKTERGWQVQQSDDPAEYQVFQSDNLNDALHNVLERAEKLDHEIEKNLEWQKNEEKAQQSEEVEVIPERFSLETQNHISRLENSDLYHISNSSKTLTEWFIEVETGAESYLAIESGDHDQQYIALEKTESGYLVRQGDAYLSASDFTEEDCPPEYKVFETSSLEAAIENMAERESRFTMTEELEAAGKADRKLEFGLDDDEKTQIIETEPEAIEPKTQVQQQEKPASLASDTEQESPEKSNFSEVGLVRLGDGIDLPEQVAGATLDGLVDGFNEGSKSQDKAPDAAPNQAGNQKKQPDSKLEKDLVDEMGVVEVDLPVQVGAAAIGGFVAGFKAAYSSDNKWDNKVKDQAGLTEASYNTRVAANNLDDIPEQIKDNNSLLRTYKEVITEQLDSKLLSSEDQTKAENLLSNTELQMHNNVMELIPEELTDVREKMQSEFDSNRKEGSSVGFEELLLANKEMLMRDLNIDIESQGEVNQVEYEASDRLDDVKAKTLESFKATPEPLNEANASTKHLANTIVAFSAPSTAAEASETAKGIHDGLSQLQGTPELKEAALAAVELIDNNPELKNAMMELSKTSDGTTEAIIETTRDVSKDIEFETPSNDFDM